jgi:hypothetical protein
MAIAYRASGSLGSVNGTSVGSGQSLGLPAGLTSGDVMVMAVTSRATSTTINTPSGWTSAATLAFTNSHRLSVFYRVAGGSESIPTVTQTVSQLMMVRIAAFSGCNQTTPLDVAVITDGNVAASTFAAPSITPVSSGAMAVWVFSTPDDNTLNAASQGTTAFSDSSTTGSDGSLALVYELQTAAAPTGTTSLTQSANGPDNWNSIVLALRPAAPVTANPSTALYDGVTFAVEIAFADSPYAPDPTWTDVSAYVRSAPGLSIQRGRQSEFSDTQPGTLSLTLANQDRRFDPDYSSSPYYGNLKPLKRIRVRARYNSVNYSLFDGFIQSWPQRYQGNSDAYVEIEAIDLFSRLATIACPETDLQLTVLGDSPAAYWAFNSEGYDEDLTGNGAGGAHPALGVGTSFVPGEPDQGCQIFINEDGFARTTFNAAQVEMPDVIRTVEAWIQIEELGNSGNDAINQTSFVLSAGCVNSRHRIQAYVPTANTSIDPQRFYFSLADFGTANLSEYGFPFTLGRSYHIVSVLRNADTDWSIFINGEQVLFDRDVSAFAFEGATTTTTSPLVIADGLYARGTFAHVAVYEQALTDTEIADHYQAGLSSGAMETAATRMAKLADFAGLVDAGIYSGSTVGANSYHGRAAYSGSVLSEMQLVNSSEQGRLYVSGSGVLTFLGRNVDWDGTVARCTTSQATIGDSGAELHYPDIELEPVTVDLIRNSVTVNFADGAVTVRDIEAIGALGAECFDTVDTSLSSGSAARQLAQARLRRYADPTSRVSTITLLPRKVPATFFPFVLALEPGTRVTVRRRPQALGSTIEKVQQVEGIEHTFDGGQWATTLYMAASHSTYTEAPWFITGDATYGVVGAAANNLIPR